jgi:hypothetical protein
MTLFHELRRHQVGTQGTVSVHQQSTTDPSKFQVQIARETAKHTTTQSGEQPQATGPFPEKRRRTKMNGKVNKD